MTLQRCIDELLRRGADDWIQAAEVSSVIQSVCGASTEAENRKLSLDVVRQVIQEDLMKLGDVTADGFREWSMPSKDAVLRVEHEWTALGRRPNLGELFWLANTHKGDERARDLFKREQPEPGGSEKISH